MFLFFDSASSFLYIILYLVAYVMALSVAMSFHEFAHAYIAKTQGDYTASIMGRCTLAPLAHIDVWGLICLFLLGFGWAKPVPVDERNFKKGKKSKFLVSIAGIVTNLLLGTIFLFIMMLIFKISPDFYDSSLYGNLLYLFLQLSVSLNFSLAFFNLIPIYPLDGFRIIETFTRYDNGFVQFMRKYSQIIYILIIISGVFYYYYTFTAGNLINFLIELFARILGV